MAIQGVLAIVNQILIYPTTNIKDSDKYASYEENGLIHGFLNLFSMI